MRASEQYHPKEVPSPGSTVLPLPPTLADSIAQYLEVDNVAQRFEQSVSASKVARGERYFFKIASGVAGFRLRQQGLWLLRHRETLPNCIPKVRKLAWAIDHAALIIDLIRGPTMQEALLTRSPSEAATLSQRCFDTLQRSFYRERSLAGCEMMQRIANRTLKRLTANYLWSDYRLQSALYDDTILIGNRLVHGCTVSLHSIVNSIGQLSFRGPVASLIHGDPHFSNIVLDNERPVFIDPRGGIDEFGDIFDVAYDLGKLLHDLRSGYGLLQIRAIRLHVDEEQAKSTFCFSASDLNSIARYQQTLAMLLDWIDELAKEFADESLLIRALFFEACLLAGVVPFHTRDAEKAAAIGALGAAALHDIAIALHQPICVMKETARQLACAPAHGLYTASRQVY